MGSKNDQERVIKKKVKVKMSQTINILKYDQGSIKANIWEWQ